MIPKTQKKPEKPHNKIKVIDTILIWRNLKISNPKEKNIKS